jgi:hypothetical protein
MLTHTNSLERTFTAATRVRLPYGTPITFNEIQPPCGRLLSFTGTSAETDPQRAFVVTGERF